VTVWRVYLAFDGTGQWEESVDRVDSLGIVFDAPLYQDPFGLDSIPQEQFIPLVPSLEWDSFVTINATSTANGQPVVFGLLENFEFTSHGVIGCWLNPSHLYPEQAEPRPDTEFGTGLGLVLIGQFTVLAAPQSDADVVDFIDIGYLLGDGGGVVTGEFEASSGRANGAYIGTTRFESSTLVGSDLDGSRLIDGGDLASLLSQWGGCSPPGCAADLNADGTVDGADLALLQSLWGLRY
jgi:hypothetical protein